MKATSMMRTVMVVTASFVSQAAAQDAPSAKAWLLDNYGAQTAPVAPAHATIIQGGGAAPPSWTKAVRSFDKAGKAWAKDLPGRWRLTFEAAESGHRTQDSGSGSREMTLEACGDSELPHVLNARADGLHPALDAAIEYRVYTFPDERIRDALLVARLRPDPYQRPFGECRMIGADRLVCRVDRGNLEPSYSAGLERVWFFARAPDGEAGSGGKPQSRCNGAKCGP